jgi:hypothetical protein
MKPDPAKEGIPMPVVRLPSIVVSQLQALRAQLEEREQEVRRIWAAHVAKQREKKS